MKPHSDKTPYFKVLDSLRGICALMVVLFHFRANSHIESIALIRNSWLFVDFFFVLSGFVIATSYWRRLLNREVTVGRFMWLRLYPLHLFILVIFLLTEVLLSFIIPKFANAPREAFSGGRSLSLLPENLALLQSFGISGIQSWNVPAWSISAEFWTYLFFAVAMVCGLITRRLFWFMALICVPVVILIWYGGELSMEADGGILRCIFGFSVGVVLAVWYFQHGHTTKGLAYMEIPVFVLMLIFVSTARELGITLLAPIVFVIVVLVFAQGCGALSRLLSARAFVFLGTLSYSIYMVHGYVFARVKNLAMLAEEMTSVQVFVDGIGSLLGRTMLAGDLFILLSIILTIMVSYLTWKYIEMPGQSWGRRQKWRSDQSMRT